MYPHWFFILFLSISLHVSRGTAVIVVEYITANSVELATYSDLLVLTIAIVVVGWRSQAHPWN